MTDKDVRAPSATLTLSGPLTRRRSEARRAQRNSATDLQVGQDIKYLGFEFARHTHMAQFIALRVKGVVAKDVDHALSSDYCPDEDDD
jgi:hypothetical protein